MFRKVLVANRGEIACRILQTLRAMGIRSVAVHSEADAFARHAREADEAVAIGGARPAESYLRVDRILEAAAQTGAEAIHPGYGFLSEQAEFAEACEQAGIVFIGPTAGQMRDFGLKHRAREIADGHGVPLLPGTPLLGDVAAAAHHAERIGYPVILKSTAGGGGIGLRVCRGPSELAEAFAAVERLGRAHFGGAGAYLEKFLDHARHVEVQIFGDGRGEVVVLGERDCSAQRRNQKVIEETPAPRLSAATREGLFEAAARLGRAVRYRSAGTVEFVVDAATQAFFFLEVNTRLQVEHGVTEAVTGVDLVEWMIRAAASPEWSPPRVTARGAAMEVRLYAEDPAKGHMPSTGTLTEVVFDEGARVDTWVELGTEVTPHYDPLLAKIIVRGETREAALAALDRSLAATRVAGLETNLAYLRQVIAAPAFRAGEVSTRLLSELPARGAGVEVLEGGTQTTVQDLRGRLGYWAVGVPPSGPMDDRAFAAANRAVGNAEGAAALEMTLTGPTLRFRVETRVAIAGARMATTLDGAPVPYGEALVVRAGGELRVGAIQGRGCRAYLAVFGGFDVPEYLGSRATFMLGRFGGHGGRAVRAGDVLRVGTDGSDPLPVPAFSPAPPAYPEVWEIGVLDGPHGAPDFFTPEDIDDLYAATFQVHYNSDRTGVRLVGPKPRWARRDGGEAGLHPSNIHDNAYAVGSVDYTGDMPVILGPDGPSLGGFVCPVTIVRAERWKVGQLRAGDKLRFVRLAPRDEPGAPHDEALVPSGGPVPSAERAPSAVTSAACASPILSELPAGETGEHVVYRRDGDDYLLVEYGPLVLDLGLRLRAHALMQALERRRMDGVIDLTPGIRSLQVHFDPACLPGPRLLATLRDLERDLPRLDEIEIPSRTVHLPLSWEDPATLLAIEKYMRSVRPDAPWCPSNIEFIRRINGLSSVTEVRQIVFDARYLVLGLGDVYLGAPVATPLDPRHRLVTTKYNPARTWTPENAVGIGGAYLCVYGMEGPGGYQFVGRTLQMWNTHGLSPDFRGERYLLRFFDQLRFEPVSAEELLALRRAFPYGKARVRIEEGVLRYSDYRASLAENAAGIAAFKRVQQAAFEAERERWRAAGQDVVAVQPAPPDASDDAWRTALPEGCTAVTAAIAGNVWKVATEVGTRVRAGDAIVVVEAMKTEIAVVAAAGGTVRKVLVSPGATVMPGQVVAVIEGPA